MKNNLNEKLVKYLNEEVGKLYDNIDDKSHSRQHIVDVVERSLELRESLNDKNIDINILYTAAFCHDLGLILLDRDNHHLNSQKLVLSDKNLCKFFTNKEIEIIGLACAEHRASYKGQYSSIYSQIVSDADRDSNIEQMIKRSYQFTKKNNPEFNEYEIYNTVYNHLNEKYGYNGYAKFNFPNHNKALNEARKILNVKNNFKILYKSIIKK